MLVSLLRIWLDLTYRKPGQEEVFIGIENRLSPILEDENYKQMLECPGVRVNDSNPHEPVSSKEDLVAR